MLLDVPVALWTPGDVREWLRSIGMEGIAQNFEEHEIYGEIILELDHDALREIGLHSVGQRMRLLKAIRQLQPQSQTPAALQTQPPQPYQNHPHPHTFPVPEIQKSMGEEAISKNHNHINYLPLSEQNLLSTSNIENEEPAAEVLFPPLPPPPIISPNSHSESGSHKKLSSSSSMTLSADSIPNMPILLSSHVADKEEDHDSNGFEYDRFRTLVGERPTEMIANIKQQQLKQESFNSSLESSIFNPSMMPPLPKRTIFKHAHATESDLAASIPLQSVDSPSASSTSSSSLLSSSSLSTASPSTAPPMVPSAHEKKSPHEIQQLPLDDENHDSNTSQIASASIVSSSTSTASAASSTEVVTSPSSHADGDHITPHRATPEINSVKVTPVPHTTTFKAISSRPAVAALSTAFSMIAPSRKNAPGNDKNSATSTDWSPRKLKLTKSADPAIAEKSLTDNHVNYYHQSNDATDLVKARSDSSPASSVQSSSSSSASKNATTPDSIDSSSPLSATTASEIPMIVSALSAYTPSFPDEVVVEKGETFYVLDPRLRYPNRTQGHESNDDHSNSENLETHPDVANGYYLVRSLEHREKTGLILATRIRSNSSALKQLKDAYGKKIFPQQRILRSEETPLTASHTEIKQHADDSGNDSDASQKINGSHNQTHLSQDVDSKPLPDPPKEIHDHIQQPQIAQVENTGHPKSTLKRIQSVKLASLREKLQRSMTMKMTKPGVDISAEALGEKARLEGYLHKLGGSTSSPFSSHWQRRYFILSEDFMLYYFKTPQDETALGKIELGSYTISAAGPNEPTFKRFAFKARAPEGFRTYWFAAEDKKEMIHWMNALVLATISIDISEGSGSGSFERGFQTVTKRDPLKLKIGSPSPSPLRPNVAGLNWERQDESNGVKNQDNSGGSKAIVSSAEEENKASQISNDVHIAGVESNLVRAEQRDLNDGGDIAVAESNPSHLDQSNLHGNGDDYHDDEMQLHIHEHPDRIRSIKKTMIASGSNDSLPEIRVGSDREIASLLRASKQFGENRKSDPLVLTRPNDHNDEPASQERNNFNNLSTASVVEYPNASTNLELNPEVTSTDQSAKIIVASPSLHDHRMEHAQVSETESSSNNKEDTVMHEQKHVSKVSSSSVEISKEVSSEAAAFKKRALLKFFPALLPPPPPIPQEHIIKVIDSNEDKNEEAPDNVEAWLASFGCQKYSKAFSDAGILSMQDVRTQIRNPEDIAALGIQLPGHRRKIWGRVRQLRGESMISLHGNAMPMQG